LLLLNKADFNAYTVSLLMSNDCFLIRDQFLYPTEIWNVEISTTFNSLFVASNIGQILSFDHIHLLTIIESFFSNQRMVRFIFPSTAVRTPYYTMDI